jgi:2-hydroxychromene-2-carboxylate isomerase
MIMTSSMSSITYYYAAYSSYTWLGSARLQEVAAAAGRAIDHRPMDLHRVMAAAGSTSFQERTLDFRNYFFNRELERWAEYRGLRTLGRRPTWHHHGYDLANRVLIAARLQGHNIDRLSHGFLDGHWADDADLSDTSTLQAIADHLDYNGAELLLAAESDDVLAQYEGNTRDAIEARVFGSPTYIVDGDMFYGQDRLEMMERALEKPFARVWPQVDN